MRLSRKGLLVGSLCQMLEHDETAIDARSVPSRRYR